MFRSAFAFILLFGFSNVVSAQSIMQGQINQQKSRWSGFGNIVYSSNLQERSTYDHKAMTSASLLTNYRLSNGHMIRGSISGYQEQNKGQETKLNDANLGWVNNGFWYKGNGVYVGQQMRAVLPSSKESSVRDEKHIGVSMNPLLIANLAPLGLTSVTFIYLPQFTKNFNKYEQNRAYQNNVEYTISQIAAVSWSITDKWFLEPSVVYGQRWSYGGIKRDDTYSVGAELSYRLNSFLGVIVGFSNAGAITNLEQGNDQTFEIFNNRTASMYTGLNYVF
jgi:hypothetical protein